MENITALVVTLENFSKELANMRNAMCDMEAEVNGWIASIKSEAESAQENLERIRLDVKRLRHAKLAEERELVELRSCKRPPAPLDYGWTKERSDLDDGSPVDWAKERADREELKCSLMVREGWRWCNSSHEELEAKLRLWTGKAIQWTAVKLGKAKNGKTMMSVRFESELDRTKVYEMRKAIAEEGYLFVGEALAYVERKERWTMLTTCERLRAEGRDVEFDNRKICVDGEWWRYCWTDGWKRV